MLFNKLICSNVINDPKSELELEILKIITTKTIFTDDDNPFYFGIIDNYEQEGKIRDSIKNALSKFLPKIQLDNINISKTYGSYHVSIYATVDNKSIYFRYFF